MTHSVSSPASFSGAAIDPESMALRLYKDFFQCPIRDPKFPIGCMPITEGVQKKFDTLCNSKYSSEYKLDLVIDSLLEKTRFVVAYLLKKHNNPAAIVDELFIQEIVNDYNADCVKAMPLDGLETTATLAVKFFSRRQALVLLTAANALDNKV